MYDANKSYQQNYQDGPNPLFIKNKKFPKINYTDLPKFNFLGIPLFIPFGVPAGPLLNSKFVNVALDAGFCLPTYKTVRSRFWKSHNWPNIVKIETESNQQIFSLKQTPTVIGSQFNSNDYKSHSISISNSFGVPSQEPNIWSADFQSIHIPKREGQHVVLSFQATAGGNHLIDDVKKTAELAAETVKNQIIALLEINLSCPNESNEPIYKSVKNSIEVLKAAHQVLQNYKNIKLIAKIGALDFESAYAFLSETGQYLNAFSAINTVSANILDKNDHIVLGSGSKTGGVCGSAILKQGLMMCENLAKSREKCGLKQSDFGIVGVGGVSTAAHFNQYRSAGADVVQSATGMMWNLDLASQIADSLKVNYK